MPWDINEPQNNTKLRLAPALLRTNFAAVEQGGVPFDYLSVSEQAGNPSRADNFGQIYSKESGGRTELFYQNDANPAVVKQLTGIQKTTSGTDYGMTTPFGLIINWGTVSITLPATTASVNFAIPFNNADIVISSQTHNSANAVDVYTYNINTTSFTLKGSASASLTYSYIAIGT